MNPLCKSGLLLGAAVLFIALAATPADAGDPFYGGYGGGYFGWSSNLYGMDYIPYYSRHPPVYYSYPVPRTYGWSPFAYPPGVMTPEVLVEAVEPKTSFNPFFDKELKNVPEADGEADGDQLAGKLVLNPFVFEANLAENGGE